MTIAAQTVKPINPPQWDWEMEIVNKNKPSFIYLFIYLCSNKHYDDRFKTQQKLTKWR